MSKFSLSRQEENFIEQCLANKIINIQTLVKYNVDCTVSNYWGYRIAACKGYLKLLRYLMSLEPNRKELADSYILSWTASANQFDAIQLLIEDGDFYASDNTAVQWTASNGNIPMMEVLLGYCNDFTNIFGAAAKDGQYKMFEFLLDNGINELDQQFENSFRFAISFKRKNIADLLVSQGFFSEGNVKQETWSKYQNL